MTDYLLCRPHEWIRRLAEGWRFHDDLAPDFTEWNAGWPVVVMVREAADG